MFISVLLSVLPPSRGCCPAGDRSSDPDRGDSFVHARNVPCVGVLDPARIATEIDAVPCQHVADAGDRCLHRPSPFMLLRRKLPGSAGCDGPCMCAGHRSRRLCRLYVLAEGDYAWSGEDSNLQGTPNGPAPGVWRGGPKKKAAPGAAPRERYGGSTSLDSRRPGVPRSLADDSSARSAASAATRRHEVAVPDSGEVGDHHACLLSPRNLKPKRRNAPEGVSRPGRNLAYMYARVKAFVGFGTRSRAPGGSLDTC